MAYSHPAIRTIPVDQSLVSGFPIAPYEDIVKIFKQQKNIVVINCVCREWGKSVGNSCDKPLETCFYFGSYGDYFLDRYQGRRVASDEAVSLVRKQIVEHGLVIQVGGGQKPTNVCLCCGDCCNMLTSLKMQPKPAMAAKSNYYLVSDIESCIGCESCYERWQMEAIDMSDGFIMIDYDRCIGCGTCIFDCEANAIRLERKSELDQYVPPANAATFFLEIAKERKGQH